MAASAGANLDRTVPRTCCGDQSRLKRLGLIANGESPVPGELTGAAIEMVLDVVLILELVLLWFYSLSNLIN